MKVPLQWDLWGCCNVEKMHECMLSRSVVSDSLRSHGQQPTRLLRPRNFPARMLEWLPFPAPADLPDPGIKPTSLVSPALAGRFFMTVPPAKPVGKMGFP